MALAAVRPAEGEFEVLDPAARLKVVQVPPPFRRRGVLHQGFGQAPAQHLGGRNAEDVLDPAGDVGHPEVRVGFPQPVGGDFGEVAEALLAPAHRLVRPVPQDGDGGQLGEPAGDLEIVGGRRVDRPVIDPEGAEDGPVRHDRERPARPEAMVERVLPILVPERIVGDVDDDDRLAGGHGGAAGTDRRPDGETVRRGQIAGRQVGRRRQPGMDAVRFEPQDRAPAVVQDFLAQAADLIEHRFQRGAADDRFENGLLAMGQRLDQLAVGDVDHRTAGAGDASGGVALHADVNRHPAETAVMRTDADVVAVAGCRAGKHQREAALTALPVVVPDEVQVAAAEAVLDREPGQPGPGRVQVDPGAVGRDRE